MNKELIEELIIKYLNPEFRGRLIDRGLARSIIWENGILPENASDFSDELTYDLLSYGYALLSLALKCVDNDVDEKLRNQAFEKSATALMTVIYNGETSYSKYSFHALMCASSYHLAHFSAKSYSLLKKTEDYQSNSILEKSLRFLLTRNFDGLRFNIAHWKYSMKAELNLLLNEDNYNELDEVSTHLSYLNSVLVDRYLEVLYEYLDLLEVGNNQRLNLINEKLKENISISLEYNFIEDWWIYRITLYLINDLWERTYHNLLPLDSHNPDWVSYRERFIHHMFNKKNAEIDLWPSQIEGAKKAINDSENLVISLPTSAGKTKIAELCILRALSNKKKVIFITPLRALSIQTEINLMNTFSHLGNTVSSLYGGLSSYGYQRQEFSDSDILISTPEKLDFLLKHDPELLNDVGLIVIDEGHMIGVDEREIRFEVLIQSLLNRDDSDSRRIVCLSAILPSGQQLDDFVSWIGDGRAGQAISLNWRPTDLRFGIVYPNSSEKSFRLDYVIDTQKPFIPNFISKSFIASRSKFPINQHELCLSIAEKFISDNQSILIYCPLKSSVKALAKKLEDLHSRGKLSFEPLNQESHYFQNVLRISTELFGSNHYIVCCLKLGIVIHHGSLPKEYRTALELLLKNFKVRLIISSPTLAQGINLQVNVVLFHSIHRLKNNRTQLIPQAEFKNVIGRAGRSFVDLQGIVLYANYDNKISKTRGWTQLTQDSNELSLSSGLKEIIFNLLMSLIKNLGSNDVEQVYEYIVNSSYSFDFYSNSSNNMPDDEELKKWHNQLNLLDYSIINLLGNKDIQIFEVAEQIDLALQSSLFYKQIQNFESGDQLLFKCFVQKRAEYLWMKTTPNSRKQLYFSGVSLATIDNNNLIIEEIFEDIISIGSLLRELRFDAKEVTFSIIQLAEKIFSIEEFKPSKLPHDFKLILESWLNGKNYLIHDDIDTIVNFIETDISYKLVWALEFLKSRHSILGSLIIEEETFDFISHALEFGVMDECARIFIKLGLKSRLQAQELANYLKLSNLKQVIEWLAWVDPYSLQNELSGELINSIKDILKKLNIWNKIEETETLEQQGVTWHIDDPEEYLFSNLKLININSETLLLSNKGAVIGKLNQSIYLDPMHIEHIYINENSTIDIHYQIINKITI